MSALSGLQWIFSKGCAESSRPCKSMLAHFRAAQGGADVLVARLGPSDPHESQNMFRVPASVYVHTYKHMYTYIYIHIQYIYMYIYKFIYLYKTHTHIHTYIHTYMHTYTSRKPP